MNSKLHLVTTTLFLIALTLVAPARANNIDGISLFPQQETNWCWAAITQTVVTQNRGNADSQCRMASRFVAQTQNDYCCDGNNGSYSSCNQPWYPGQAMSHYGVLDRYHAEQLAQSTIVQEVQRGYPVPFNVMWSGGGGHALLFYGAASYVSNGETVETLHIWDPANGGDKVVMSRWQAENYRGGRWQNTFTTKCPNNQCGRAS